MKKLDIQKKLRTKPLRGIISEIAKEKGVTPQAIWNAIYVNNNTDVLQLVMSKIRERRNILVKFQNDLENGL